MDRCEAPFQWSAKCKCLRCRLRTNGGRAYCCVELNDVRSNRWLTGHEESLADRDVEPR